MSDRRQFIVLRAQKTGQSGQNTKFRNNKSYAGKTPVAAAKKAFKELCKTKKIKGQCSLNVTIKEIQATASGSPSMRSGNYVTSPSDKAYKYRLKRKKDPRVVLRNGIPVTYKFVTKAKSLSSKSTNKKQPRIKF